MKKLFDAIKKNNIGEVKALVEKDFTLVNCVSGTNPKKDIGQSPLQVALKNGSFDIAEYLIGCGADINRWGHSYRFPQYNLNPPSESISESSRLTNIDVFIGDGMPWLLVFEMGNEL